MVNRARRNVRNVPATKRSLVWADTIASFTSFGAGATIQNDGLSQFNAAYGAMILGATITRIVMTLHLSFAVGAWVPADTVRFGWLKAARTLDAIDMRPGADPFLDWMWNEEVAAPIDLDAGAQVFAFKRDIHSQRKLEELDETLFFGAENQSLKIAQMRLHARILLKLP